MKKSRRLTLLAGVVVLLVAGAWGFATLRGASTVLDRHGWQPSNTAR